MTTHPIPHISLRPGRRGFTLIELLAVIAIIAILAALSVPIAGLMSDSGNSVRSINNLKAIGAAFSSYSNDHDDYLPAISSDEQLDWSNLDVEIDDEDLEELPYWARALIHFSADNSTDLTRGTLGCPGLKWKNSDGKRFKPEEIVLAYGVTEALYGFDGDGDLSDTEPRKVPSIENLTQTVIACETKQDGAEATSFPVADWSDADRDFSRTNPADSKVIDFRFKKAVNCLKADGTVESIRHKDRRDVEEPYWTGLGYKDIR